MESSVAPTQGKVVNADTKDGLPANWKTDDGRLWCWRAKRQVSGVYRPNWSSMMPSQICAASIATFSLMKACWVPV